jgi:hypothetical protein
MNQKNSIVEEALISMQNLEEVIAENAKGILASTMKQEIKDLVKESLQEQETEDEEEGEVEIDTDVEDAEVDTDIDVDDTEMDMDTDVDDTEIDMDMDTDSEIDSDDEEEAIDLTNVSDEELIKVFKAMSDEDGIIVKKDGENIHLKDEDSDSEYMIKLGESIEDQIEETEENDIDSIMDSILNSDSSDELDEMGMEDETLYEISMDDEEDFDDEEEEFEFDSEEDSDDEEEEFEFDSEEDFDDEEEEFEFDSEEDFDDEEETLFESKKSMTIKPKGKNIGSPKFSYKSSKGGFKEDKAQGTRGVGMGKVKKSVFTQPVKKTETKEGKLKPKGVGIGKGPKFEYKESKGNTKKVEPKEASRTLGNGKKWGRNGLDKPRTSPRHIQLESELSSLREKNEEYRKALNIFREKLNEVAVFNSNLAYATRLFTEHSTTKQEKLNILERFDGAESLKESKSLYKTIKSELSNQEKPIVKEAIENKIEKVQQTGSSINLIESTTYENPQFLRMKDLMSKLK